MIILLFDTSKLDISDEYKLVLQNLKGNEEKVSSIRIPKKEMIYTHFQIKIVLNKADCVDPGELIRVRGALMWSLSKIIATPEVPKVYIGSFMGKGTKVSFANVHCIPPSRFLTKACVICKRLVFSFYLQ